MHQDRIGNLPPLPRGTTMGTTWRCVILVLLLCGLAAAGVSAHSTTPPPEVVLGVSPYDGMFQLYNDNRARGLGHYITVDFVLTTYSLFMHELLTRSKQTYSRRPARSSRKPSLPPSRRRNCDPQDILWRWPT